MTAEDPTRWKAWGMTGVIAKLGSSRGGEFAALSWEWVMRADGQVSYRLAAVDGHREHNPWMDVTRLPAPESRLLRHDRALAVSRLAELARQRGHEVNGRPELTARAVYAARMSTMTSRTRSASTIALIIGSELTDPSCCPAIATCPLPPARHAAPVLHSYPAEPVPARPPGIPAVTSAPAALECLGLAGGSRPRP